jgi:hypothetical protein
LRLQRKPMPLTRFRAVLQGSSRYVARMERSIEQVF